MLAKIESDNHESAVEPYAHLAVELTRSWCVEDFTLAESTPTPLSVTFVYKVSFRKSLNMELK